MANALFSYSDNYLIDTDHGVTVDVEATRSIRQAEVGSTKTMLKRVKEKFYLQPERLIADTAHGTGPLLDWLVDRKITPHVLLFDKAGRSDGTWTRADCEWDAEVSCRAVHLRVAQQELDGPQGPRLAVNLHHFGSAPSRWS